MVTGRRIEDIRGGELLDPVSGDLLVILDKSDTSADPDGTTKYVDLNTLYDASSHFYAGTGAAFNSGQLTVDGTNDVDVDLNNGNHWEIDLDAATGTVDMDIVVPTDSAVAAGTLYIKQDGSARDINWNPDTGSGVWPEGEPDWSGGDFPASNYMLVNWAYYGTINRLILVAGTTHT